MTEARELGRDRSRWTLKANRVGFQLLILKALQDEPGMTKAQLGKLLKISQPTLRRILDPKVGTLWIIRHYDKKTTVYFAANAKVNYPHERIVLRNPKIGGLYDLVLLFPGRDYHQYRDFYMPRKPGSFNDYWTALVRRRLIRPQGVGYVAVPLPADITATA